MMKKLLTVALLTLTAAVGASIKGEAPKSFGTACSSVMFCSIQDYCANIEGVQSQIPWGMELSADKQCVPRPVGEKSKPLPITSGEDFYRSDLRYQFTAPTDWMVKDYPVFVLVHGGGWTMGNKEEVQYMADFLAQRGFKVFSIQYRLSQQGVFNPAYQMPMPMQDVDSFMKYLMDNKKRFAIEHANVSIGGPSAGGHLSLYEAIHTNKMYYQCAVSIAGPTQLDQAIPDLDVNLTWQSRAQRDQMQSFVESLLVAAAPDVATQQKYSVLYQMPYIRAERVHFVHNTHDYLVNYQQSWRALQLLKGKKSATMHTVLGSEYNDYGHSLTNALILREWEKILPECY